MSELKPGQEVRLNPHPLEYSPGVYLPDYDSPVGQEVYGPLHDLSATEWQRLQDEAGLRSLRLQLSEIEQDANAIVRVAEMDVLENGGDLRTPIIEDTLSTAIAEGGEMGMLAKKEIKKRARRQKEQAPRQFSEMLVVFNDVQLLQEADQEALGAFLQFVKANRGKITHLVANGDIADFTAQSFFEKDLGALNASNDEIEAVRWLIDTLSTYLPDAEKVFIEGNHEARWGNLVKAEMGNEPWVKTLDEQFGLKEHGWKRIGYGSGQTYEWHDRIFWHGHRSSIHTAKAELMDAGTSVTTGHINRNQFFETTDARGQRKSGITHGGFSKDNLGFMKKANTGWSQGFGVYFYDKKTKTETPYMVSMSHRNPVFIGPDGNVYDGTGFEIPGFEKPKRGRPRGS